MSKINKETIDVAVDIISLQTTPASITASVKDSIEGEQPEAIVGALGALQTFASVVGKSSPFLAKNLPLAGQGITGAAIYFDVENAIEQYGDSRSVKNETILSLASSFVSLATPYAAVGAGLAAGTVAGIAVGGAFVLGAAALTVLSLVAEDDDTGIGDAIGGAIADAKRIANNVGSGLGDNIQSLSDSINNGIQAAEDGLGKALENFDEVSDAVGNGITNFIDGIFEPPTKEAVGDYVNEVENFFDRSAGAMLGHQDPLIFDLDGDGLELTALNQSNVKFDLDANNFAETVSWVSADDGLLVLDRNGNGNIDNGTELFGDRTPINNGDKVAADGFAALKDLDSNSDGVIDTSDQQFSELKIWQDKNQNGVSESTELSNLADLGISSINLNTNNSSQVINGNNVNLTSSFTRNDGTTGEIGNTLLQSNTINSEFIGDYKVTLEALLSPSIRGYGNVADLHIAASQNDDLLTLIQNFLNTDIATASTSLASQIESIIFEWAGTKDIDPNSRGTLFDARKLEALEAFLATDFVNMMGNGTPMMPNLPDLNNAWDKLVDGVLARLAIQSFGNNILNFASYSFGTDSISIDRDLDAVVTELKDNQPQDTSDAVDYWITNYRILDTLTDHFSTDLTASISNILKGTLLEPLVDHFDSEHIRGSSDNDSDLIQ